MPTNIIAGSSGPAVSGNAWQSVGAGAQGLAALLGSAFAARSADQAAKQAANAALPAPTGFGEGSSFGPSGPVNVSPPVQAPGSVAPMDIPLTRQSMEMLPQPAANPFGGANDMGFKLGRDDSGGINSLFSQRFPSLFPQASRNLTQYGGL